MRITGPKEPKEIEIKIKRTRGVAIRGTGSGPGLGYIFLWLLILFLLGLRLRSYPWSERVTSRNSGPRNSIARLQTLRIGFWIPKNFLFP